MAGVDAVPGDGVSDRVLATERDRRSAHAAGCALDGDRPLEPCCTQRDARLLGPRPVRAGRPSAREPALGILGRAPAAEGTTA